LAQRSLTASGDPEAEVSLALVGNSRIRGLNYRYRQQDCPTDVLAFPIREAAGPRTPLLGDVVISFPKAAEQAARYGHSIEEELMKLLIHGILHLKGYDHERGDVEARRMRRKEREILSTLRPLPKLLKDNR
jgi:rRNA maturation RNase YbeY